MHPKNTTAPPGAQQPHAAHANPGAIDSSQMPDFTESQRAFVIGLLKAERRHASRWWTFLQELRLHRQLPDWVFSQEVGRHSDYDAWSADCRASNRWLLQFDGHINGTDPIRVVTDDVGTFIRIETDLSAPQNDESPFCGAVGEVAHVNE